MIRLSTLCTYLLFAICFLPSIVLAHEGSNEGMSQKEYNLTFFSSSNQQNLNYWKAYNGIGGQNHPEFGILPFNYSSEQDVVEVLDKRTATERHFIDIDKPSKFYVQTFYTPAHYLEDGKWRTIEYYLEEKSPLVYESKYYYEPAGFDFSIEKSYIQTIHGKVFFNKWTLSKRINGEKIYLDKANWGNYTIGDEGVRIFNIFDGIDAEMIVSKGRVKTNFIMKSNQYGSFDELIFTDEFTGVNDLQIAFKSNQQEKELVNSILINQGNLSLLEMSEGVAYVKGNNEENPMSLAYAINEQSVDVVVPFFWIDEHIDEYNLVIDPLVSAIGTLAQSAVLGSMYNANCSWTNFCDYTLNVNFPGGAEITNVTTSFAYIAQGACGMSEGAMRFLSGACMSPGGTLYWTCSNNTGPGTCSGVNIDIFNSVLACMPSISCNNQSIPFTLQFYRQCSGNPGCDGACIGAAADFSVTITGETLEFENANSPIRMSRSHVCEGSTLTATATTARKGVPPYTYSWSLNPSGTPVAGSGQMSTITFSEAGQQKVYLFLKDACGTELVDSTIVTVSPLRVPEFEIDEIKCQYTSLKLPNTSLNNIKGTWSPFPTTGDLGKTTYTFNPDPNQGSCVNTASVTVTVSPNLVPTFDGVDPMCKNLEYELPALSNEGIEGVWSPPLSTNTIGKTRYTFTPDSVEYPCAKTALMDIEIIDLDLNIKLNTERLEVFEREPIHIYTSGNIDYEVVKWEPAELFSNKHAQSQHLYADTTRIYSVYVENEYGCYDSDSLKISVIPIDTIVFMPNAFSPNNDGNNDEFGPELMMNRGYSVSDFRIFNRVGQEVFNNKGQLNKKWDGMYRGQPAEVGTYFYTLNVKFIDGTKVEKKGEVHLIR